jgi:hypothetical protein
MSLLREFFFYLNIIINASGTSCLNQFWLHLISRCDSLSLKIFNSDLPIKDTKLRHQWLCCMYFSLPNITSRTHIQKFVLIILPSVQNTATISKYIIRHIIYDVISRFWTLLKSIYAFHIISTVNFDNNSQFQKTNKCTVLSSIVQYSLRMFRLQLNHLQGVKVTFILHPLVNQMI